jgi:hypothetical protein
MTTFDVQAPVSVPEGSEVLMHEIIEPPDRCWNQLDIDLYVDPEQENPTFKGSTLLHRMKQRERALGAQYLDWLLENPTEILPDWGKNPNGDDRFIFFWATQYSRLSDGQVFIRYLYQTDNGLWREGSHFLNDIWPPSCLAAEWKQ